jgi:hypothetical protein
MCITVLDAHHRSAHRPANNAHHRSEKTEGTEHSLTNIRWLLRMIAKKGVPFVRRLYLRLCQAAALSPNWSRMLRNLTVHAFTEPEPRLVAL